MGAVIRIDNASHVKDHGLDAIIVSNGVRTNLALKHEYNYIKSKPYSNCDIDDEHGQDFDSNLFKLIHASPYDYTSNFCFVQCLQQLNINECKCSYPLFASVFDSPKCGSVSQIQCVLNVYYTKFLGEKNFIENNCSKACPLECNSTQYKYTSDSNELIGDVYLGLLRKNKYLKEDFLERTLNTEMARKSVSKINIFFESLSYDISSESPQMDVISLVATMGGNLGLFLGVSLLSVGELITTLIELISLIFRQTKVNLLKV